DKRWVRRFVDKLVVTRGWSVWWDHSIRTGEDFDRQIEKHVTSARCVVVIWSSESVESEWVRAEAAEGWKRGALLPILIDDCEPPMPFRQTQAADFTLWSGGAEDATFRLAMDDIARIVDAGGDALPAIRAERLARRKRMVRRRKLRWVSATAIALFLLASVKVAHNISQRQEYESRAAGELAGSANELRATVLQRTYEEQDSYWPYVLTQHGRMDTLQLATLLAAEAYRISATPSAERALYHALGLLVEPDVSLALDDKVGRLEFSPDGELLVGQDWTGDVVVWRHASGDAAVRRYPGNTFAINPKTGDLVIIDDRGAARILDPKTERELAAVEIAGSATSVAYSADGMLMIVGSSTGQVRIFNAVTGQEQMQIEAPAGIGSVSLSANGAYGAWVAAGVGQVFRLDNGQPIGSPVEASEMTSIIFDPSEVLAVTDGWVTILDLESGDIVHQVVTPTSESNQYFPVYGEPVFAPEGKQLLIASRESVLWWDIAQAKISIDRWHTSVVHALALSSDGNFVVTGSGDKSARAWLRRDGAELARFAHPWDGRRAGIGAVAVSPDSSLVATSTPGTSIDIWEVWPDDPLATACDRLDRNLTPLEWEQYLGQRSYRQTCPDID
ncbi:MAG: TIR domain-containing protein, partial [Pseudomonadota bacterium]